MQTFEAQLTKKEDKLNSKEREIEEIERLCAELQQRGGQQVGASTVAGTDYIYGGNSGNGEDDGVNIGSNEDEQELVSRQKAYNSLLQISNDSGGILQSGNFKYMGTSKNSNDLMRSNSGENMQKGEE